MTAVPAGFVVIPCQRQAVVPWRNGGGSTREVAIDPPSASAATGFRWRVSIASVAGDGPFSVFPGVDRSLWLLAGQGMRLDIDGRTVLLDRPLLRFDFAGETAIHASLIHGPIEDLNVMTDRARVRATAQVVALAAGETRRWTVSDAGEDLWLVLAGQATAGADGSPGQVLECRDAGRRDGGRAGRELQVIAGAVGATVLVASFAARAQ